MNTRIFIYCIFIMLFPLTAQADMILNKSIIYFEPDNPNREDLEIQNAGTDPLYISRSRLKLLIILVPISRREIFDNPKQAGLLVSPNKLVVPPNGRKLLRFVNLNPNPKEEKVYRVSITPVVGELSAKSTGVKIMIGYEVLVIVHPVDGHIDLTHQRSSNKLTLSNQGTQNVLLRKGTQCPADVDDESLCHQLPGKRLYPGNTWSVDLEADQAVTYFLSRGKEHSVRVFE